MNFDETLKIMDVLEAAYPQHYRNMTRAAAEKAVLLWVDMFADDDARIVAAAVKSFIATDERGFHPQVGAIKAEMRKITKPREMSEHEAWGLIAKAVRNSAYNSKEEFEKLPPALKRIVGSPNQLREWSQIDVDDLNTVVSSNIQRSYRSIAKAEKEWAAVPAEVKNFIAQAAGQFMLDEGGVNPHESVDNNTG